MNRYCNCNCCNCLCWFRFFCRETGSTEDNIERLATTPSAVGDTDTGSCYKRTLSFLATTIHCTAGSRKYTACARQLKEAGTQQTWVLRPVSPLIHPMRPPRSLEKSASQIPTRCRQSKQSAKGDSQKRNTVSGTESQQIWASHNFWDNPPVPLTSACSTCQREKV